MLQNHVRGASHGFGKREPGQHPGQKIERETGTALVGSKSALQYDAKDEKVSGHEQQRIQNGPEDIPKRAAVARQNIAPRHGSDQTMVLSDGPHWRGKQARQHGPDLPPAQPTQRRNSSSQNAELAA